MKTLLFNFFVLFFLPTGFIQAQNEKAIFTSQTSNSDASLRGLCVVNSNVVWASGTKGTVLLTQDSGKTWEKITVKGFEDKDFRDIHAFDNSTAIIINAGSPAYVLRTEDSGQNWKVVYENNAKAAFLDDLAFADDKIGLIFGDPDESGNFLTLQTKDGGKTWDQNNQFFPTPIKNEAGFAASGSILQLQKQHIWLATGGGVQSRVFYSSNEGKNWVIQETPILAGKSSQGIFSICTTPKMEIIAVGGDYEKPKETKDVAVYTLNKGLNWELSQKMPSGYRSGVARSRKGICICVGTSGSDMSFDDGKTWKNINQENLNAIRFDKNKNIGWAVGGQGKIFKITFD